jgi:hypothetical protein
MSSFNYTQSMIRANERAKAAKASKASRTTSSSNSTAWDSAFDSIEHTSATKRTQVTKASAPVVDPYADLRDCMI